MPATISGTDPIDMKTSTIMEHASPKVSPALASPFDIFEHHESNVRTYCRQFPAMFTSANGAVVRSDDGREYLDFFAGAGTLNYGHNHPVIKQRLLDYIAGDGIVHALDLYTEAKRDFIDAFVGRVMRPAMLDYKLQFPGPTGANAVEAALKVARRHTGRSGVFAFMGGYHGLSMGALATTANRAKRAAAGTSLHDVTFVPYPDERCTADASLAHLERLLTDTHSGVETPAAVIVETVQAEGGINVAPVGWLQELRVLCDRHGIVLVCDDIQVGCYRSGPFFSFQRAGIVPDIVTLSKGIGGYGLPMSLVLLRPSLDHWQPGEHTGTFRGNQLAFVAGCAALELADQIDLPLQVQRKGRSMLQFLADHVVPLDSRLSIRGLGMIWGLDCSGIGTGLAERISARCFELGLVVETAGRHDAVLKLLPPLTIDDDMLADGLAIVQRAVKDCLDG